MDSSLEKLLALRGLLKPYEFSKSDQVSHFRYTRLSDFLGIGLETVFGKGNAGV